MIKRLSRDIRIHRDKSPETGPPSTDLPHNLEPIQPAEAMSPIGLPIMNSMMNGNTRLQDSPRQLKSPASTTIRTVPAEPLQLDTKPSTNGTNGDLRRAQNTSDPLTAPTSKSYGNITTSPPLSWQNNITVPNGLVRSISSEFGPVKTYPNSGAGDQDHITNGVGSQNEAESGSGRAGQTGKSGRVINQLITENDKLKRDLQFAKLQLEESRNATKMADAKRDQMATSMEREAQEAAYNTMQLKRRERLLAEAKESIEYEKRRAADAESREKAWKDQLDDFRETATREVAQAKEKAAHMEAGYITLRSHWPGEQAKMDKSVATWRKEISDLVKARKEDDERINLLRSVSEQHAKQMSELQRQKDAMQTTHETYKEEQERGLKELKQKLKQQEEKNERLLEENQQTLGRLKWALGVKENVKDVH